MDDGVDDPKIAREWIEQILNSKVQPRLIGVRITRIDMSNGQFGYVICVPPTQNGPHQSPDQKYYRRYDLQSVPMHDYEIKDIMRRSTTPDLFTELTFGPGGTSQSVRVNNDLSETVNLVCTVKNRAAPPAYHAVVDF